MALKKIKTSDLKVGMYVNKVHSSWLSAPLAMKNFMVQSPKTLKNLLDYEIQFVSIDTIKGRDVGEAKEAVNKEIKMSLDNTFAAPLTKFRINRPVPVDFYFSDSRGALEHILKKELPLRDDVVELFGERQIQTVRIPEDQKSAYDRYRLEIENEDEQRKKQGFDGKFVDPEKVRQELDFIADYYAINALSLVPDVKLTFDIYERFRETPEIGLRKEDRAGSELIDRWLRDDTNILIKKDDKEAYQSYLIDNTRNSSDERVKASFIRENAKLLVENLIKNPRSGKLMAETKNAVSDLTQSVIDNPATFYSMMRINNHDYYTYTHSVNVSTMSLALALALGMNDKKDLSDLGLGSIVHDLGKSKVDNSLINKPGKLTDKEFVKMKDHVTLGVELLKENKAITERMIIPAAQHHEKLSGRGYPNGLAGDQMHLFGRISSLIDIYDALTTERSYKKAFMPFDALAILFKGQDDYDMGVLQTLVKMLKEQET
ncbi:Metal-dependent phosphohydrolase, HD subdomain [hydrothermal vent metagenome]|uniref:Metal-dependent phosphohydrolase, HD subdomain n=1 Tax=hydrothermal vent metagenome TaxID=652676 RepID=A0A3B1CRW3_9ZZZZ